MLGISQVRVRELIKEGKLDAVRVGRSWAVQDGSVQRRLARAPRAGRPREGAARPDASHEELAEEIHELYLHCEALLASNYDISLYKQLGNSREARFCARISDFFLQEKQRELIEAGVF